MTFTDSHLPHGHKKPQVIYIAETNHADLSYPAITEQIIRECDAKELHIKVFSEFGNKEHGLGSEDEKSKVGYFKAEQINQYVNQRCSPMGNVYHRFNVSIQNAKASLPENVTPSDILELIPLFTLKIDQKDEA